MNILRNVTALLVMAGVVSGCATARIVEQTATPVHRVAMRSVVVIVAPLPIHNTQEQALSDVYFAAFDDGLHRVFDADGVPVTIVHGKPDSAAVRAAMATVKPSHIMRFYTDRTTSDYGMLIRGHWLLDVLAEQRGDEAASAGPHMHQFDAVYNASINANTCFGNNPPISRVQRCGRIFAGKITDKLTDLRLLDRSGRGRSTASVAVPAEADDTPASVATSPVTAPASQATRLPAPSLNAPVTGAAAGPTDAPPSAQVPASLSQDEWLPAKP